MKTELPFWNTSGMRHAGIFAALATAFALLFMQTNSTFSAEVPRGATILMTHNETKSLYARLPSELSVSEIAALVEADRALPEQTLLFPTERQNEPVVQVAVHLRGSGTHACVLVLIHGVLASHESWRYVTGELASDFDLWIVDLPGCGQSDKPDPQSLTGDGYSPTALADRVFQAIGQCLAKRTDSPRMLIIAHSLGGMIALRMMDDPELRQRYDSILQRIDGSVLLAPADVSVNQEIPCFIPILNLNGLKAGIGGALGILQEVAAKSAMNGFVSSNLATRESADQICYALTHVEERLAAQAMLRQAVPWLVKENQPGWEGIGQLEAQYRNIKVPCLIVWGRCDEVLPEAMGHKLKDQIPGAKLVVLYNCKHSIELECPATCVKLIRDFRATLQLPQVSARPRYLSDPENIDSQLSSAWYD